MEELNSNDINPKKLQYLQQQAEILDKEIKKLLAYERNRVVEIIILIMQIHKVTLRDIEAVINRKNEKKICYTNPETGATWSGRGRPPKWVKEVKLDDSSKVK